LIRDAIASAGLLGKRVGIELESAPTFDVESIRGVLGDTQIVNSSPLMRELRMIKTPQEIERHRLAARITEAGISGSLVDLDERTSGFDIQMRFRDAVSRVVVAERISGFESAATTLNLGPHLWGPQHNPLRLAARGDLVQFDGGVQINGTMSDVARTFSFGTPSAIARLIEDALLAGHAAGLEQLRPGSRFCDVYEAAHSAARANGIPSYLRGHLGHSIGSVYIEEWPFFSATEQRTLEPGMIVAFEVPYYANGIGGFQNENNYLITEDGHESFNHLPMALVEVG
jgi:Xaa-Pro aminopeptidase